MSLAAGAFGLVGDAFPGGDERFQLLLDSLPDIAFVIAPGGRAEYYNQRFTEYLGFRPGIDKASRTAVHHPDDRDRLEASRGSAALTQHEYTVEARILRHDGVYRWHRIHNKPLLQDGRAMVWLGTAVDIDDVRQANEILEQRVRERTAELEAANRLLTREVLQRREIEEGLRASEARYRTLYNRTPMALQSVDSQARLIDVNDTWTTMFECEREYAINRSPAEFMIAASAERYRGVTWPGMLASGGQVRTEDYQFLTRSGRVFEGRLSSRGDFDAEGRFVRSWSVIADVTAEKRADQELRQAQRMEAVGQLTAGIAHDFNNLLTAILGNLEMLSKQAALNSDRAARMIGGAKTAAERGAKLTAQLLAFSRQQRITAETVDLNQVMQGMLPLLRSTLGAAISIQFLTEDNLWMALADPTQLELAILNLAINARDAMPQGGTITVATANVTLGEPVRPEEPAAGNYVAVSVSDTGTGIPDAVRERIFEPFFTTKEVGKGSGLGLPQVLGVVKQLGGGIRVASTVGEGTSISIFMPRADPAAAVERATPLAGHTSDPAAERSFSVLLVDDDDDVRTIAAAMLHDAGYDVVEAASGAAALDALKLAGTHADLLLADVAMPGISGVELAAVVRRMWPALPVLFMSGYADTGLLPADCEHDTLRKPFQATELEAKVKHAIHPGRNGKRREP